MKTDEAKATLARYRKEFPKKKDLADNMEVVLTNLELDEGSW